MNEVPENFMMIGLHKLAAERGDGLIPELLALYTARQELVAATAEPSVEQTQPEPSTMPAGNDNVIQFRPYLVAKRKRG